MNLGLLLIPALGGYYLLSRSHISRYWVARQSGYKLFFSAAIAGAVLLAAARLVATALPADILSPFVPAWRDYAPFEYAGTVAISAILAVAIPLVTNSFFDKNKRAMHAATAHGDLVECLIQEAVDSNGRQLVEVSTKGSKCYIGFALESGMAAAGDADIAIVPVASGYRDSETRELRITMDYLPALQQSDLEIAEFRVVIPLSEIASARRFDPDIYKLFDRQDTDRAAPPAPESEAQIVESAR